jgi:hypothetical protein
MLGVPWTQTGSPANPSADRASCLPVRSRNGNLETRFAMSIWFWWAAHLFVSAASNGNKTTRPQDKTKPKTFRHSGAWSGVTVATTARIGAVTREPPLGTIHGSKMQPSGTVGCVCVCGGVHHHARGGGASTCSACGTGGFWGPGTKPRPAPFLFLPMLWADDSEKQWFHSHPRALHYFRLYHAVIAQSHGGNHVWRG